MLSAMNSDSLDTQATGRLGVKDAELRIDPNTYSASYNKIPFGFYHNLHQLDIFQLDSLRDLVARYGESEDDYFVAASAAAPGSPFFEAASFKLKPKEALEQLDQRPMRILLKKLEQYDDRFRELRDVLINQLRILPGGLGSRPILRIQSSIFISSAAATTPLHFDPEVAFFTQIEGGKTYHVFSPDDVSEKELEAFYSRGQVSIGQLDIKDRDPKKEQVYNLEPGLGFHQPQNSPHWVETCGTRSISYSCVFETDADRALSRVRAFNHYERKLGATPAPAGVNPNLDALKEKVMIPNRIARGVLRRISR